ncbi:hypothetical protein [Variovorax sp. JS1663]|uniref:hypothetical protein n=1 Tax=Variovorax sp. JS1663 TaxID=1851577 RepID=UPI000B347A79|nr:hypothetical protein [Variovorax sp. JS1663]OUL98414.1 hypothetical protein A8M77_31685 [Variovorax sp. JS1663]
MPIALLDFPAGLAAATPLSFARPASLDFADLLIWRPAAIAEVYATEGRHEGRPVLQVLDSQRAFRDTRFWREEFLQFLGRGGTLALFAPAYARLGLHTVQDIVGYDILEALPDHADLGHDECEPAAVQCEAGQPFRDFFAAFGAHFRAASEFRPRHAQPIATLAGTGRACALYQYRHPGRILVLPALREGTPASVIADLVTAVQDMSARLRFDARASSTYAWREPLVLPREAALQQELAQLAAQRRALQAREAALIRELAGIALLGQLQRGDAVGVIEAALQVFHALGAYVQQGVGTARTLMVERDGRTCVVVTVDDAEAALDEGLAAHVQAQAAPWAAELRREVAPVALYIGGNRRGARETAAELEALRRRHPGVDFVSGAELLAAYETGDATLALPPLRRDAGVRAG